jgi:hypothetical protein
LDDPGFPRQIPPIDNKIVGPAADSALDPGARNKETPTPEKSANALGGGLAQKPT